MFPLKRNYIIISRYLLSTPSSPPVIFFTGKGTICSSKADSSGLFACLQEEASHFAAVSPFYFLENWLLGMRSGTARDVWTLFWGPVLFLSTICLWSAHGEGKRGCLIRKCLHKLVFSCLVLLKPCFSRITDSCYVKHEFNCIWMFRYKGLVTRDPIYYWIMTYY